MRLAELFVEITGRDGGLSKTLAATRAGLMGMVGMAGKAGAGIAGALAFSGGGLMTALAGGAAVAGIAKIIHGASHLNETLSKTGEVFGSSAGKVIASADEMAKSFGVPKREFLDAAAQFGLIAQGAKMAEGASADFSTKMAKLALDVASFYDLPTEEALGKLRSGLSGESMPLKELGVSMEEAEVKAQALAMGFKLVGGELSQEAKFAARTAIIQRGLAKAMGDLERTSDGAENQSRKFWGALENISDTIGMMVLPAFTEFLQAANSALTGASEQVDGAKSAFGTFGEFVHTVIGGIGFVFRNFSDILELAALGWVEWATNTQERISYAQEVISAFLGWFSSNFTSLLSDALNASVMAWTNWGKNVQNLADSVRDHLLSWGKKPFTFTMVPLLKGFEAKTDAFKLPEQKALTDLSAAKQEVLDRIAKNEEKRLEEKPKPKPKPGKPDVGAAPERGEKQEKAKFTDLTGFIKDLQTGAFGKNEQKKQTELLTGIKKGIDQQNALTKKAANNAQPAVAVAQ